MKARPRLHPAGSDHRLRPAGPGADAAAGQPVRWRKTGARCRAAHARGAACAVAAGRNRRRLAAAGRQPAGRLGAGRYHWELQVQPWAEPRRQCRAGNVTGNPWLAELQLQVRWGDSEREQRAGAACACCRPTWRMRGEAPRRRVHPGRSNAGHRAAGRRLALAFASVRSAMAVSQRGEQIAAESERMRAVESLLRRQLAGALRTPLGSRTPPANRCSSKGRTAHAVRRRPARLPGRGGSYPHALQVDGREGNSACCWT